MTSDPDDALRWDGDEPEAPRGSAAATPRPKEPVAPAPAPASPEPTAPIAPAPADVADAPHGDVSAPQGPGNAALIGLGVIGGVYLLFAIGWLIGGLRLKPLASMLVSEAMFLPWMWLAILAPLLWFAAAWVLTRGKAGWVRILAVLAGIVLLVPWPFVMFGAVGS